MKKIMFNDKHGLTQAVIERRKTMTRRIINDYYFNQWDGRQIILGYDPESNSHEYGLLADDGSGLVIRKRLLECPLRCGEVLAVAQSYASIHQEMMNGHYADSKYDAFRCASVANVKGWKNKMFVRADLMPYNIQTTDIKIERLQDITDDDIVKEGVRHDEITDRFLVGDKEFFLAKDAFAYLIDKVSKKGTWQINPYVYAYSFQLIEYPR